MKRLFAILAIVLCSATISAQNLALGERIPPVHPKYRHWLGGHTPQNYEYTYIGFVHSASVPCIEGTEHIRDIAEGIENMRIIILTKESEEQTAAWLKRYAEGRCGVACRCEYPFRSFCVNYAPFGVVTDHRNRVLWFGNPKQLTREQLLKFTTNNKKHKIRCRSLK